MPENDWIEKAAERLEAKQERERIAMHNANVVSKSMAGLWRSFREQFTSELGRYLRRLSSERIDVVDPNFSELSINTTGCYPAVHLKVSCCGETGTQLDYVYTVTANFDVDSKQHRGHLVVYAKDNEVFLKTGDGENEFANTLWAVQYLLSQFVEYASGSKK